MQFFIDSKGTTHNLIGEPIYQGSTYANELVLVAPLSASNVITATFRLPIGISTQPYLMALSGLPMQINGMAFNVWRVLLDGVVTQYAGKVTVQFSVYQNGYMVNNSYKNIKLATYASTFVVGQGVTPVLPSADIPSNIYEQILTYLAQLDPQYNIRSITYSSPGNEINSVSGVGTTPTNSAQKYGTDFSVNNVNGSQSPIFYFCAENYSQDTGFTITFADVTEIGKMQLTINRCYNITELQIKAEYEDGSIGEITSFKISAPSLENVSTVIEIGKAVKAISVIQPYADNVTLDNANGVEDEGYTNGRFCVSSVLFWAPNLNGLLTITSSTGRTITIPSVDASIIENASQSAIESAQLAQNALAEINAKAGQAGGYPILENIGGSPKIPSVYINLVNPTEYVNITSVSELETLDEPVGTVARLVVDIDGDLGTKTVTQSFVKLQEGTGTDKWALYASSYADNASNALYAEQATNALKVNGLMINGVLSEADYNALVDKTGVYFISIEGEANGN